MTSTANVLAHDPPLETALAEPDHLHFEEIKMTVGLVAESLGPKKMNERPMAPISKGRRWMLTSRRMRTKMRWKR
jgi:hypothetical protein